MLTKNKFFLFILWLNLILVINCPVTGVLRRITLGKKPAGFNWLEKRQAGG
jgi:hypothetical protein